MDGENTTMTSKNVYARSVDSKDHISRHLIKKLHGDIQYRISEGLRICGENLYAKHSIHYKNLKSHFMGFSVWENDICLDWDKTEKIFSDLGIETVPILYIGKFDSKIIKALANDFLNGDEMEGYVVRPFRKFHISEFNKLVLKYVRQDHVKTDKHWMYSSLIKNEIIK
jgi:hypothetical protein